jgi:hypothetical protein
MDAAEKSLLLKILEGFTTSEKIEDKDEKTIFFLKDQGSYIEKLKARFTSFGEKKSFSVGNIIVWKDGLKNKNWPLYGQPAIVTRKRDTMIDEDDPESYEDLDIQAGFVTEEGDFFIFNYDSSRFKMYTP